MNIKNYKQIGTVRYIGEDLGPCALTNEKTYVVINIEYSCLRVIDDSEEDYLYSIVSPGLLDKPEVYGKWKIVDDPYGLLTTAFEECK